MLLSEIVTQLKYGELRSIAVKDDIAAIVSYVNLALLALYSRFDIRTDETIIDLVTGSSEYTLPSNAILINNVYNELGQEISIGDRLSPLSVHVTSYNTIQIPYATTGNSYSVIYKAAPTLLTYVDETSLLAAVPVPPQLIECLLHYVGYRAHGSMDGNIKAENNTHFMRYEAACQRVEDLGLIRSTPVPAYVNTNESISGDDTDYEYDSTAEIL